MKGQRELNRMVIQLAASLIDDGDYESLFGDVAFETPGEEFEERMEKAKQNAVRRIRGLLPKEK